MNNRVLSVCTLSTLLSLVLGYGLGCQRQRHDPVCLELAYRAHEYAVLTQACVFLSDDGMEALQRSGGSPDNAQDVVQHFRERSAVLSATKPGGVTINGRCRIERDACDWIVAAYGKVPYEKNITAQRFAQQARDEVVQRLKALTMCLGDTDEP